MKFKNKEQWLKYQIKKERNIKFFENDFFLIDNKVYLNLNELPEDVNNIENFITHKKYLAYPIKNLYIFNYKNEKKLYLKTFNNNVRIDFGIFQNKISKEKINYSIELKNTILDVEYNETKDCLKIKFNCDEIDFKSFEILKYIEIKNNSIKINGIYKINLKEFS